MVKGHLKLAGGNEWCNAPDDLPAFRKFIAASKAMKAVAALKPTKVELDFNQC